jgi:cbb3-type cytochrome oxidase subunit 3
MPEADHEKTDNRNETGDTECGGRVRRARAYVWQHVFEGKSAAWTALFTGFLVLFTYWLYQVAGQTDLTARNAERAYIVATEIRMTSFADNQPLGARVLIANVGHTPAYHMKVLGMMRTGDYPPPDTIELPYPLEHEPQKESTLTPGSIPYSMEPKTDTPVEASMIEAVKEGKRKRIYVWGTITYQDVFGKDHFTNYCYMFGGELWKRNDFEICPHQNDAN